MEPAELAELVKGIRAIEQARGATKKIQPGEQDVRNMALHSVVSIRDIAAGATIAPPMSGRSARAPAFRRGSWTR